MEHTPVKPPFGSCAGAALDVLFDLVAGLAKVNVHIHQAGDEVLCRKGRGPRFPSTARFSPTSAHLIAVNQDVNDTVKLDGRVDDVGILRSKAIIGTSKQQIQDRHTHADTGVDLLQDDGALRVVGHIGVELDAAVDGARVATIASGFMSFSRSWSGRRACGTSRMVGNGAPSRRSCCTRSIDDVQLGQDGIEVARHVVAAQDLGRRRQQRAGGDGVGLAAHDLKRAGISEPQTREWAISPTTATFRPWKSPLVLPDGVQVEQGLRRMVVLARHRRR